VPAGSPLVFLQTSDWHVGSPLTGRGLAWPAELRAQRRDEVDAAAERAVKAARVAGADALLVPGDLWDAESVPPSSIHRVLAALASFAPRPVFVAPGNHDFAGAGGFYDPAVLAALGMRAWPENVVVFREPEWTARPFPGRDDVAVVGRAFLSPAAVEERPLASRPPRPDVPHAILLVHGSLETYPGADAPRGGKRTAPFTRDELMAAGFSWAALGHHHHLHVVTDGDGTPRAAYSGAPTGRGLDEAGPRVFLKVTLGEGRPPAVETLPADGRTLFDLSVDVSDLEAAAVLERVDAVFADEGVSSADVVRVTLTGTQPYGARPAASLSPLLPRVAHLVVRDGTVTAAAEETSSLPTAEGRFFADLAARRAAAPDAATRRAVDLAIRLGRDALAGRAVRPPEPERG
jgi:DNA repair exonuclease SbcCD nuclease subunit